MGVETRDTCTTIPALSLPTTGAGVMFLQHGVDLWHQHKAMRGLTNEPEVLCLQVMRFKMSAGLELCKDSTEVNWGDGRVFIPSFAFQESNPRHTEYRVCSVNLHVGNRPDSGHYRSLLLGGTSTWITDDDVQAMPVEINKIHRTCAYQFWCVLNCASG